MKVEVKINNKWYKVRQIKQVGSTIVYEISKEDGSKKAMITVPKTYAFQDLVTTYLRQTKQ